MTMTAEARTDLVEGVLPRSPAGLGVLAGYCTLTKPDINLLIGITVFVGFCLGRPTASSSFPVGLLINSLLGTMLVAGGSGALNQYIERQFDAQMRRTARRPLASGKVEPHHALWFGILLSSVGALYHRHADLLPGALYSAQTKDSTLHSCGRSSRSDTTAYWLGCSFGRIECGCVGTLRDALLVAIPGFYGHRMDVSRGLRPRWIHGSSTGGGGESFHGLAEPATARCLDSAYPGPHAGWVCGAHLRRGRHVSKLWLSVLGSSPDFREIELCRTPASDCFHHLPANDSLDHGA